MQRSINEEAQKKRRQDAYISTVFATVWLFVFAFLKVYLAVKYQIPVPWSALLISLSVIELGMIILVWILLKKRLKEIEGGEEDVATQY